MLESEGESESESAIYTQFLETFFCSILYADSSNLILIESLLSCVVFARV
jgi:hypothetical protein